VIVGYKIYEQNNLRNEVMDTATAFGIETAGKSVAQIATENRAYAESAYRKMSHNFQGDGFSLMYPGGWEIVSDSRTQEYLFVLTSPTLPATLTLPQGLDGQGYDNLEVFVEQTLNEILEQVPNMKIESKNSIMVDGRSAIKVISTSEVNSEGSNLVIQVFFASGKKIYLLSGSTGLYGNWQQGLKEIEEIIESFKIQSL